MKTFTIATIIAVAANFVSAAPAAELEARDVTNVLLCYNANFNGPCKVLPINQGSGCHPFPNDYNDQVSSLKTGGENNVCFFYTGGGCTGSIYAVSGQHPTIPAEFNDKLSSVRCP